MYHTTVCTTLTYTRKTGDSLTPGMHTNMHTQCWVFFSCKSKINVVFRNFVLTQICVHDIFDVFMCNNIRLYQALPIIICTSPNVTTQSRPFRYKCIVMFPKIWYSPCFSQIRIIYWHPYIPLQSLYILLTNVIYPFFCQGNTEILIVVHTSKYVIETLSWINGYFFSAGCNLCTLYNHILFKNLLKSEATRII